MTAKVKVVASDVLKRLRRTRAQSFDALLTDPPYGIGYLTQLWDARVPSVDVWTEVRRVLRPGAPMLVFASPRTAHRMALAIESAGLVIVDQLTWIHGGGMAKNQTTLRPLAEPILLARAPGPPRRLNLEGCRVGAARNVVITDNRTSHPTFGFRGGRGRIRYTKPRLPGNVLVDDVVSSHLPPFFYASKARGKDRFGHPASKPPDLTEYLARLLFPRAGARLLVTYAGTGGEVIGAMRAGWRDITAIEMNPKYARAIETRVRREAA